MVHLISNDKLRGLTGMKMGTKGIMGSTVCECGLTPEMNGNYQQTSL